MMRFQIPSWISEIEENLVPGDVYKFQRSTAPNGKIQEHFAFIVIIVCDKEEKDAA